MNVSEYIGVAIAVVFLWGIPLGFIVSDPVVSRKERIIWAFATIFVSWFSWLLFMWIAPVLPKENQYKIDANSARR